MPPPHKNNPPDKTKPTTWSLFGLPVNNLTMTETQTLLRNKIKQEDKTVISTINVNWIVQSFKDPVFRDTIINSDIVVLDGKPLLWLAKYAGYPFTETVPGSSLIQELQEDDSHAEPLTIFLFGGEAGAGKRAMTQVNSTKKGLRVVGELNPGFGTVKEMSNPKIINAINKTNPDILLVALGANKGNKWITQNRDKLNARIISHLGATINFLGGTIKRAPLTFRSTGTEWVWRILQEPKLFTRYLFDGLSLIRLIFKGKLNNPGN